MNVFDYSPLYSALDAAQVVAAVAHDRMMQDASNESIDAYEDALDAMADARKAIGVANDADMRKRSVAACLEA